MLVSVPIISLLAIAKSTDDNVAEFCAVALTDKVPVDTPLINVDESARLNVKASVDAYEIELMIGGVNA